jgi:hypothetical protein
MPMPVVTVLFCDDAVLVVNKPAGLLTLPDGYHPEAPHLKSVLEPLYGRLWIVHRLDRDTSGAIVLARSPGAHRSLNEQFAHHQVGKTYHALLVGEVNWEEKTIDLPLRIDVGHRHRTVVDLQRGKPATTHLRVQERYTGKSSNITEVGNEIRALSFTTWQPWGCSSRRMRFTVMARQFTGPSSYPALRMIRSLKSLFLTGQDCMPGRYPSGIQSVGARWSWKRHIHKIWKLHYFSCERFPRK